MNAKEMFEKIGYKLEIKDDITIIYTERKVEKIENATVTYQRVIKFLLETKRVGITNYPTELEELKAINQQMGELGWLDE